VDFYWGDYEFHLNGGEEITLSQLFEKLNVTEIAVSDVEDVTFSDESLVKVEKQGEDWVLKSLKAFSTEEKLTLTLKNGNTVEIRVTDNQRDSEQEGTFRLTIGNNNVTYWDTFVEAIDYLDEANTTTVATIDILDLKEAQPVSADQNFDGWDENTIPDETGGTYEIDKKLEIENKGQLTINGNGHTLTRGEGAKGVMFEKKGNGALIIKNLTFDGSGDQFSSTGPILKVHKGNCTLEDVVVQNNNASKDGVCAVDASASTEDMVRHALRAMVMKG
jgi:hypothetical protein